MRGPRIALGFQQFEKMLRSNFLLHLLKLPSIVGFVAVQPFVTGA